ncbi:M24 family metallopeptidase [Paenibacillus sp. y28]|uniref:M24 family metallopeptidase n=1 Tax=Paenibacillus sp. y28 TaxID=3129110 RepID=UPI0030185559
MARIHTLQQKLHAKGIDGMVIAQNVDVYYFTGSMQTGYFIVPAQGEPVFYVRRSVIRAQEESAVQVEALTTLRGFGSSLKLAFPAWYTAGKSPVIAAEFDVLPVQVFQRLQSVLPGCQWVDGSLLVREARMIKSPVELAWIREAARVIDVAFQKALDRIKPGLTELELLAFIELAVRLEGHLGLMRMRGFNQETVTGMVGAGEAAAKPTYFDGPAGGLGLSSACPQTASRRPIRAGEPILVDIGCCIEGYVVDQTRTVVIGSLEDELTRAYEAAEQILHSTEALLKPGTVCEDLYTQSLRMAAEYGLSEHFMGFGADQVKFLGHGIGLEIDEFPVLAKGFAYPLEPGMVLAIEPKFTFPGRGVVGIENNYAITEQGYEKLTRTREGLIRL